MCEYGAINQDVKFIQKRRMFDPLSACYNTYEQVDYKNNKFEISSFSSSNISSVKISFTISDANSIINSVKEILEDVRLNYNDKMKDFNDFETLPIDEAEIKEEDQPLLVEPLEEIQIRKAITFVKMPSHININRKPLFFRDKCRNIGSSSQMNAKDLLIILLNASKGLQTLYPVFKITLTSFDYKSIVGEIFSGSFKEAAISLCCHYYNPYACYWEPIIEKCDLVYSNKPRDKVNFHFLFSENPININVSDMLINIAKNTFDAFNLETEESARRSTHRGSRQKYSNKNKKIILQERHSIDEDIEGPTILKFSNFSEYPLELINCNDKGSPSIKIEPMEEMDIKQRYAQALDAIVNENLKYEINIYEGDSIIKNIKITPTENITIEKNFIDDKRVILVSKLKTDTMQRWIIVQSPIKIVNLTNRCIELKLGTTIILNKGETHYVKSYEMNCKFAINGSSFARPKFRDLVAYKQDSKIMMHEEKGDHIENYCLYLRSFEEEKVYVLQLMTPLKIYNYLPSDVMMNLNSETKPIPKKGFILVDNIAGDHIQLNFKLRNEQIKTRDLDIYLASIDNGLSLIHI